MQKNDLFFTLALLQVEGIGDITAKKLLQHFGSAEEIFKAKKTDLAKIDGIGKSILSNLKNPEAFRLAEAEIEFLERESITGLYFQNDNYPERLKHCIDAPVLLFQSGNVDVSNSKIISIVGTRNITT